MGPVARRDRLASHPSVPERSMLSCGVQRPDRVAKSPNGEHARTDRQGGKRTAMGRSKQAKVELRRWGGEFRQTQNSSSRKAVGVGRQAKARQNVHLGTFSLGAYISEIFHENTKLELYVEASMKRME